MKEAKERAVWNFEGIISRFDKWKLVLRIYQKRLLVKPRVLYQKTRKRDGKIRRFRE
jgi:hypothetical protein